MEDYMSIARSWLSDKYDVATRTEVARLIGEDNYKELEDRFYKVLEFGTGGLRGIMGAGTNRMNRYTVGMATQGLSNYMKEVFCDERQISVVISYDSRNNSREFAMITSDVFLANGFKVYIFDNIRPTPELSFAIRHLGCKAGVMVTASHNPKEYNGYKVFWEDGAQIVSPHDTNIIAQVSKISDPDQVMWGDGSNHADLIGEEIDKAYLDSVLSRTVSPDSISRHPDIKIVYTPLHGTGVRLVPRALKQIGFTDIIHVPEQDVSDGNFPTTPSPNPEEPAAMKMAMEKADRTGADIVLATDPDADRIGAAVRNDKGELVLLTGNQICALLTAYLLERWDALGKLDENVYVVKTIVTTELVRALTDHYKVKLYDVLTGFKHIAKVIHDNEGRGVFIGGGEESNGYNASEYVRDKDSVIACSLFCECAAWLADSNRTIYRYIQELYAKFGNYREGLVSIYKTGVDGLAKIQDMMAGYRQNPPKEILGSPVVKVIDYLEPEKTGLPSSNVLQFFTENGTKVSVRPSGTEPKIKYYFGCCGPEADSDVARLVKIYREM